MNCINRLALTSILVTSVASLPALADDIDPSAQQTSQNTQTLVNYILNLGGYLGYDLTQPPTPKGDSPSQQLLNPNAIMGPQLSLFDTLLGALPVDSFSTQLMQFVPSNGNSPYADLNALANTTFKTPPYNSPTSQQGGISVSNLIDQQNYQQDPVNQAVLNILATPDSTYCMDSDGVLIKNCTTPSSANPSISNSQVASNILGKLPATYEFFTYDYNQKFLSQLNSNTLLSPLLYSTNAGGSDTSSSPQPSNQTGLPAQSQAQQASNFIRYASGAVMPMGLPQQKDYDTIYSNAANVAKNVPIAVQMKAQTTLANYFASLRVYAAQSSVGFSNLYYILSKRMPQSMPNNQTSSQALSEFTMATWRLFNPDQKTPNVQWVNQINQASPATVQKEMVTLLAEINYQLYLNRQQEERLLLTQTMLLIQNSRTNQPNASSIVTDNSP